MSETEAFSSRLLPRERILWSGRPAAGLLLSQRDIFLIPFSILWCGFAVLWTGLVVIHGPPVFDPSFDIVGVVFVCVGLFFFVGRFFFDGWLRGGARYALTDRRVLILKSRPTLDFTAADLDRLPQVQISERRDGSGTIRFGPPLGLFTFGRSGFSIWVPSLDPTPQFIAIPDARQVFDRVQQAINRDR